MMWEMFGGMFDLDGDGETDLAEEIIGVSILDRMMSEEDEDDEE